MNINDFNNNNTNNNGGAKKERVAQDPLNGAFEARIVEIIDLGVTLPNQFFGAKPEEQMFSITVELSGKFLKEADGTYNEKLPRWISIDYNMYQLKNRLFANADPDLSKTGGEIAKLIGLPVVVVVSTNTSAKNGKVYENIKGFTPVSEMLANMLPELKNPSKLVMLADANTKDDYNKMPQWKKDKVAKAINWVGSALQVAVGGAQQEPQKPVEQPRQEVKEDDVPDYVKNVPEPKPSDIPNVDEDDVYGDDIPF